MGWKASFIIVSDPVWPADEGLLRKMGFLDLVKKDEQPFEAVINPKEHWVYIGKYKDNLIICTQDVNSGFFEETVTPVEERLHGLFPKSEICAVVLHSVVNLWGFAVTINKEKIRAMAGSADDGTFLEMGAPLPEEMELLSKAYKDENGNRVYNLNDDPDDLYSEDAVGENYVFEICARYFGEDLDGADAEVLSTMMTGYTYKELQSKIVYSAPKQISNKPWWKIW